MIMAARGTEVEGCECECDPPMYYVWPSRATRSSAEVI